MGSDYETTGSTFEQFGDRSEDAEEEYEEEESEMESDEDVSEEQRIQLRIQKRKEKFHLKQQQEEEERLKRFNPVKFLAEAMKELAKQQGKSSKPDSPIQIKKDSK